MKNTIWSKHIPTLLGIAIITIGIAITSFLVKSGTIFIGQASPAETPQNLKISNISDSSFTVSYTTEDSSIGSVNFGKDKNLGSTAFDLRDQKQDLTLPHKIHMITLKNLAPETRYYFSIASGQKLFLDNDVPFEVSTAPTIQDQPSPEVSLQGYVILPDGSKPKETIVYATTDKSQVTSTLLKEDGSYTLQLDTNDKTAIIKILIQNEILKSNVSVFATQDTLPTVTLSHDYDFTENTTPIATESAEFTGFPSISVTEGSGSPSSSPKIILPKRDQEFSDQKPQFTGTALPNETVTITIHSSEEIEVQVTADVNGNWKYRPTTPLPPGQHTITIITRDAFGILKTITQSFTVFAQGTQVNQSATPSATPTLAILPTPTRTPTPTPTKTLALAPTLTPTPIVGGPVSTPIPTPTLCPGCPAPTPNPLLSLSPTPITIVTPVVTIAPPGDSSVLTVGILGVTTAAIGLLLFLLTRKGF